MSITDTLEHLFAIRAPSAPPKVIADLADRLIWCTADNGSAILKTRERWLRGQDRERVAIALAMDETFPFQTRAEMVDVLQSIAERWPEFSKRCSEFSEARNGDPG